MSHRLKKMKTIVIMSLNSGTIIYSKDLKVQKYFIPVGLGDAAFAYAGVY